MAGILISPQAQFLISTNFIYFQMNAFVSWSGGKDCMLALYRFLQNKNQQVVSLINMCDAGSDYSRSHGLPKQLIASQAKCMNLPIVQPVSDRKNYESVLKQTVAELKKQGVTAGVFGDIYLKEHREWIERVCMEMKVNPIFPLWENDTTQLLQEFIHLGFKSLTVSVHTQKLSQEWLGKEMDQQFLKEITQLDNIDPCAEEGEYHSFVYDGPLFSEAVSFSRTGTSERDNHYFLHIQ